MIAIPGPGFLYALTGVAEAMQDSAALLLVVGQPASRGRKKFVFQCLDQAGIAGRSQGRHRHEPCGRRSPAISEA